MAWVYSSLNDLDIVNVQAYIQQKAEDVFYKDNPLLFHLMEHMPSNRKAGLTIDVPIVYDGLGNSDAYAAAGSVTTTRRTGLLKQASYAWAHYAAGLTVAKPDVLKNQGERRFEYLDFLADIAMKDLKKNIQTDLWNSVTGANEVGAIFSFCDPDTATLGGITLSDPWIPSEIDSGSFSSRGVSDIRNGVNTLLINSGERPTAMFTSQTWYEAYQAEAYGLLHLNNNATGKSQVADLGFEHCSYLGIPIYMDSFASTNHDTKLLMVNTNKTFLYVHPNDEFELEPWTPTYGNIGGTNTVEKTAVLTWTGALVSKDPGGNLNMNSLVT